MKYNFDKQIDRKKTGSLKWDHYPDENVIPLWVADMDFPASDEIITALKKRVDHGVLGYTLPPDELFDSITDHLDRDFSWKVKKEWIICIPGVVTGLNIVCRCAGNEGDDIMVPVPVYPPFFDSVRLAGKNIIKIPMIEQKGRLTFDFDHFESLITDKTRFLLLCSPHNPGGTVFNTEELEKLANLCNNRGIIICSDEIHCGLILNKGQKHIPTALVNEETAQNTITLMAPSKTYNIPGMGFSFAVIPNENLRNRFRKIMEGIVPYVNALGYTAATAAYRDSALWHSEVIEYLIKNRDTAYAELNNMPGIRAILPDASYLIWIDVRETGLKDPASFFEENGVGLSDGAYFGCPGFLRLNFGCSRQLLEKGLGRMKKALEKI